MSKSVISLICFFHHVFMGFPRIELEVPYNFVNETEIVSSFIPVNVAQYKNLSMKEII